MHTLRKVLIIVLMIFMFAANCTMVYASDIDEVFLEAAQYYDIDEDILVAIATLESGYGSSNLAKTKNNWFGWMCFDGSVMRFNTPEEGIWHVTRAISNRPHDTIEEIAAWYNPLYADIWSDWITNYLEENTDERTV